MRGLSNIAYGRKAYIGSKTIGNREQNDVPTLKYSRFLTVTIKPVWFHNHKSYLYCSFVQVSDWTT